MRRALLRLNPQRIAANGDLLVRLDHASLVTREFAAGDQGWVSAFGCDPISTLVVERECCMNAANFGIAFERQVDRNRSRAAPDRDFRFGNWHDRLTHAFTPQLNRIELDHARTYHGDFAFDVSGSRIVNFGAVFAGRGG